MWLFYTVFQNSQGHFGIRYKIASLNIFFLKIRNMKMKLDLQWVTIYCTVFLIELPGIPDVFW